MSASLVGSEMCIRDRSLPADSPRAPQCHWALAKCTALHGSALALFGKPAWPQLGKLSLVSCWQNWQEPAMEARNRAAVTRT
eukprot:14855348-Alexandrium_andersonii.AAC.1